MIFTTDNMRMVIPDITHDISMLPFYVTGIGVQENQEHILRETAYSDYQLAYCTSGAGIFIAQGKSYEISKGDAFFFRPNILHEYFATDEPWEIRWIIFRGHQIEAILKHMEVSDHAVYPITEFNKINSILDEIYFLLEHLEFHNALKCSTLLYTLIVHMGECISIDKMTLKNKYYEKLKPVITMIEQKYNTDISLDEMRKMINVSPSYMCRLFKQVYHTTPFKYLMQLRIRMAKQLFFQSSTLLVKDVAVRVGFNDTSYFCSVFKQLEGITPDDFRKSHIRVP